MNKRLITLSLIGLASCLHAEVPIIGQPCTHKRPSHKAQIADIRKTVASINTHTKLQVKVRAIHDQSAEGGQMSVYSLNHDTVKVAVEHMGEMGNRRIGYYFVHGDLRFVLKQTTYYNAPITFDDFDNALSTTEKDRYYFYCGKMIRWMDSLGRFVPQDSDAYRIAERNWFIESRDF